MVLRRTEPERYHTLDQLRDLYEQVRAAKPLKVYLTGGEPMLHPEFEAAVELFADGAFELTVFTNATLVDDELIDRLEPLSDDVSVQVSFDGLGQVHEDIRGITIETVIEGIECLRAAGFEVHSRTTVQPTNVDHLEEIYEACVDIGVDYADFAPILPTFGWDALSEDDYRTFQERMVTKFAELLTDRESFPVPICQDPVPVPLGYDVDMELGGYICPAGNVALEVDASGEVFPCPYLHYEEFSIGNVYRTDDLLDLWQSVDSREWEVMIDYWNVDHDACRSCDVADRCKGACHAAGYHELGGLSAPDFRCPRVLRGESDV